MKTAVLFSGQGTQVPGMMRELIDAYPAARELFDTASALLGRDLYALTMESSQEELNLTENTQPCLLACELAAFRVFRQLGLPCDAAVGFSLGEWAALSACGAAEEAAVLRIIAKRAAAMQRAVSPGEGGMAAVLGKDASFTEALCRSIGNVAPANYNCPGNITVAGTAEAVERLLTAAQEQGVTAAKIQVSVPSHCALMAPAVEELLPALQELPLRTPHSDFIMNATGATETDPVEIRKNLSRQLIQPVRFQQSIEYLLAQGYEAFVEIGPGKTLTNMVRRTAKASGKSVQLLQFNSLKTIDTVQEALIRA